MLEFTIARHLFSVLWDRLVELHRDKRGYTTEAVAITAAMVALAITVTAIIAKKVVDAANSIKSGPSGT